VSAAGTGCSGATEVAPRYRNHAIGALALGPPRSRGQERRRNRLWQCLG